MSKQTSGTVRLLLKTIFGILLAGAIGFVLLVVAYLALAKTPAQAAAAPAQEGAVQPVPITAGPPTTEELRPVQVRVMREVKDPETGEVRRVPVYITEFESVTRQAAVPSASEPTSADRRALELAAKIRGTENETERVKLREQLLETLGAAFDERRERQSEAIDGLEKQLEELRALYEQRGERKDEIVQRRMSELLAEPDVLAWDPQEGIANAPGLTPTQPSGGPVQTPPTAPYVPFGKPRVVRPPPRATSAPDDPPGRSSRAAPGLPPTPTFEAREESVAPSAELRSLAAADAPSSASGEAVRFGDAERILELLAEIAQIEAERNIGAPRVHVERRLQLARAKLEIADVGWAQTEQVIRDRIDAADAQRKRAEDRRRLYQELYKKQATPISEVLDAEAEFKQAQAELRTAENLLEAWQRADAVVQKYRDTVEADAAQPNEDVPKTPSDTTATAERDPAAVDEQEAAPPQDSETVEP